MDGFSMLPDDAVSRILSFLPTKNAVHFSVQSKRLWNIWKTKVQKLEYDYSDFEGDYGRFQRFVDMSLVSHETEKLESLHLKIGQPCDRMDINTWLGFAVRRHVRELEIRFSPVEVPVRLPRILYVWETLVVMKLNNVKIVNVPFRVCFPKLKTLHLHLNQYQDNESFHRLLRSCPILEDLFLELSLHDNVSALSVEVPTLQRFVLDRTRSIDLKHFEIDAPSLKYLRIDDYHEHECLMLDVPEVVEAEIEDFSDIKTDYLLGCLTSVRQLAFGAEVEYPTGCILDQLEVLELSLFNFRRHCLLMLMGFLEHSPKLRVLKLTQADEDDDSDGYTDEDFDVPDKIPKCLLFHLEILNWKFYAGAKLEKTAATYILKNAVCLKQAIFYLRGYVDKLQVMEELEQSPRVSDSCRLVFR